MPRPQGDGKAHRRNGARGNEAARADRHSRGRFGRGQRGGEDTACAIVGQRGDCGRRAVKEVVQIAAAGIAVRLDAILLPVRRFPRCQFGQPAIAFHPTPHKPI